jgi:hypothetical protein
MTIKTINYDVMYLYPVNALIFIWDGRFTTQRHGEQLAFGKVTMPPGRRRQSLEIEVFTDIFEISH